MKLTPALALTAALGLWAAPAAAGLTVITFDELPLSSGFMPVLDGYQGFNWENFFEIDGAQYLPGSGYAHGTVSAPNVAFNGFGMTAAFSRGTPFTLASIEVTKAWNNGLTHFDGYLHGALVRTLDVVATTGAPTLAVFNWANIDRVTMSDGNHSGQSAIDNLTIGSVFAVPEPSGAPMLALGLGTLGLLRRLRRAG